MKKFKLVALVLILAFSRYSWTQSLDLSKYSEQFLAKSSGADNAPDGYTNHSCWMVLQSGGMLYTVRGRVYTRLKNECIRIHDGILLFLPCSGIRSWR